MSLPEIIKSKFSTMSTFQKIAAIVMFPLTLLILLFKAKSMLENIMENKTRDKVDQQDKDIQQKIQQTNQDIAKQEGKLEQLNEEKQDAESKVDQQDPVAFHNDRKSR